MTRYKITIEYDGTNLLGWQKQLDGPSVQDFLEKALYALCSQAIGVSGAGRTDAGVHASGQVAHFDLETRLDDFRIREALNAHLRALEAPVCVLEAEKAGADFHARFSAQGRIYVYKILNRRAPPVLQKNRVWWIPVPLDAEKMRRAARFLLGRHDFSSFRAAACQASSPIKTLDKLDMAANEEEITFTVAAKSFLHHQVRNMVGTLKMAGDGSFGNNDVKKILEARDRALAGPTAPACGLCLARIIY